ncbi:MAG TPA: DegT/DnrJ/EryC1/StrS aminotransferase family protein [Gemmatimonadaceae bacterium]|nr:DegT/DnrJ/EryC1/StrS aminotransferase family protein [Gemmatimonadaceae bacterium]
MRNNQDGMLDTAFSAWPSFTAEEAGAVSRVLLSNRVNYWTGTEGREFEKEFAIFSGSRRAIALANGTLALDIALIAMGIRPGDEVVVTPRSFIASVSSVVTAGATPVFADVDPDSGNITADTIARVLSPRTRAIIPVHLAGWPCDMDPIMELARAHGLVVVEDCAQAHGATYKGRSVGSIGQVGAWSFCQDKIMTTGGEGGMVTTDDEDLWSRMWSYKDHGKSYEAVYSRQHARGFRWVHDSFGTNWRMLEIQSALGRIQLNRMPDWQRARAAHAARLAESLAALPALRVPLPPPGLVHAWYKFYAYVRPEALKSGWTRDRIMEALNDAGLPCSMGSCSEIYQERAFDGTPWRPAKRLPVAKALGETALMFLVHPTIREADIDAASRVVSQVMADATA